MKKLTPHDIILGVLPVLFSAWLFAVLPLPPAIAQEDLDLFEELEETPLSAPEQAPPPNHDQVHKREVQKRASKKEFPPWMAKLGTNFTGSLRLKAYYFFEAPKEEAATDTSSHDGEALFRFATWTGTDDVKLKISGWAEAGTRQENYQADPYWLQDLDNERQYFEINQAYALISRENVDITLGKKLFNTGISTLFSPSDRFRPMDFHDPMDPKQFGIWQATANYYPGDDTITLAVLPVYRAHKVPSSGSRWWGEFANHPLAGQIQEDYPSVSLENMDLFSRYKTTKNGWDFFVSANTGPNPYSVVKREGNILTEKIIRIYTLAGGFSTTWGGFELHGETLYNLSDGNKDQDYLSSVLGFTYTIGENARHIFMEEIHLTLEYAGEIILDQQKADTYLISSEQGRPGTNDLLSKIQFKYNEALRFENLFHYDIADKAWMNRFEFFYRLGAGWTTTGAVELFGSNGDIPPVSGWLNFDNISYAQWTDNNRVVFFIKYEF